MTGPHIVQRQATSPSVASSAATGALPAPARDTAGNPRAFVRPDTTIDADDVVYFHPEIGSQASIVQLSDEPCEPEKPPRRIGFGPPE